MGTVALSPGPVTNWPMWPLRGEEPGEVVDYPQKKFWFTWLRSGSFSESFIVVHALSPLSSEPFEIDAWQFLLLGCQ